MHFMFFLHSNENEYMNITSVPNDAISEPEPTGNISDVQDIRSVPIEYPYGIVGIVTASLAVAQFVIFVMARDTLYTNNTKPGKEMDVDKSADGSKDNVCTQWLEDPIKRTELGLKIMLFLFWCLPIGTCPP